MPTISKSRRFLTLTATASESRGTSEMTVLGRRLPLRKARYEVIVDVQGRRVLRAKGDFTSIYNELEKGKQAEALELLRNVADRIEDPKGDPKACFSRREQQEIIAIASRAGAPFRGVALSYDVVGSPLSRMLHKLVTERILAPKEIIYHGNGISMGFLLTEKGRMFAGKLMEEGIAPCK